MPSRATVAARSDALQRRPAREEDIDPWREVLAPLDGLGWTVSAGPGWSLERERGRWRDSVHSGRPLLSVRWSHDEVLLGPLFVPGTTAACAGCAEVRQRAAQDHPLLDELAQPRAGAGRPSAALLEVLRATVAQPSVRALRPGALLAVRPGSVRRHAVLRSAACPVCSTSAPAGDAGRPPPRLELRGRAAPYAAPTRSSGDLLEPHVLHDLVVDGRFGPVLQLQRESVSPFAMSMAIVPDSPGNGYGRAASFAKAEPVALLEGFERLAGRPVDVPVVADRSFEDVRDVALDPAGLGGYTAAQRASALSRVLPRDDSTPMDWVWAHALPGGVPVLVPAEIGFYQYQHRFRGAGHTARLVPAPARRMFLHDSSSGCALGSTLEEAALHSLLELAERDAFLLSWHRAAPLPRIAPSTVTDPESRRLLDLVDARGFDTHLLVATQDVDVPVVWAMAVNRRRPYPATFSAAGSGVDPAVAVRSALWELGQVVTDPVPDDRSPWEPMHDDPWLVDTLDDHLRLYTLPERLARATAVLGGPEVPLLEAWPHWPDALRRAAAGDVLGALRDLLGVVARAGLDRVLLVDQSSREHADLGVVAAKAVVPGIVPMCFGQAHQRLSGLPRLTAALVGTDAELRDAPYDPHPFP